MLATVIHTSTNTAQILFIIALFASVIYTAFHTFYRHDIAIFLGLTLTFISAGLIFLA